jgi:hypothetical protein
VSKLLEECKRWFLKGKVYGFEMGEESGRLAIQQEIKIILLSPISNKEKYRMIKELAFERKD